MRKIKMSMKVRFNLHVIVGLAGVVVVTWVLVSLFNMLNIDSFFASFLFPVVISVAIGEVVNIYFGKRFFEPIMTLSRAMKQVAEGDFSVRLDCQKEWMEIQELYENFNIMAKELGATEILQTDFVTNVSHEFKTPINAIEGYATLLQDQESQMGDGQEIYVEKILFNTKRLSKLVGNILLLSKVDNQAVQTRKNRFRLDEQIRQSIVLLEQAWSEKNLELDVDLEDVEYWGNESLLHHVWDNLIGNAIKFSPENETIHIKMRAAEKEICFEIENAGEGITEEDQKHLFDKFYQGDSSHKQEGNGLGLALVNKILGLHEGAISMENIPEGGCRFIVKLNNC